MHRLSTLTVKDIVGILMEPLRHTELGISYTELLNSSNLISFQERRVSFEFSARHMTYGLEHVILYLDFLNNFKDSYNC